MARRDGLSQPETIAGENITVPQDHYKVLGVRRDASAAEIQKAYRSLARKYHPDLNPNDKAAKQKFQEVQQAFDVLSDSSKREMYDRYGSAFESAGPGGPQSGYGWSSGPEAVDLGDLFGERFGHGGSGGFADIFQQFRRAASGTGRRARATGRGRDLEQDLEIPFTQAVTGGQARLTIQRSDGRSHAIDVKIPPGVEDGQKIRLRGQGEPGPRGTSPGDILLRIRVCPHPYFRRRGNDLEVRVPVTLTEAIQGGKVDVPTPKGTISLRVPPHTSSGQRLRVRGHGIAAAERPPGDLYAEIMIVLPTQLADEDRQHAEKIAHRYTSDPRAELRW